MRKALGGTILSATLVLGLAGPVTAVPTENGSSDSTSTTLRASAVLTPAAAAKLKPTLKVGARTPAVVYVQQKLGVTPASGYYGAITKSAVKSLQKAKGLKATGTVTKATWKVLLSSSASAATAAAAATPTSAAQRKPLLKVGARTPAVVYVQQKLGVTPASGYYGTATNAAVRSLQKAKGLKATGTVTKATWKVLLSAKGVISLPADSARTTRPIETAPAAPTTPTPTATTQTPEEVVAARPTLKVGMGPGHPAVVHVQQYLGVTPATGYFGTLTKAAVTAYQKGLGISATGTVGPLTWAAIAAGEKVTAEATPTPPATPAPATPAPAATTIATPVYALPDGAAARDVALVFALAQVGKRYVLGGNGPDIFDCSGLVQQAYLSAGVRLPRLASQQRFAGAQVTLDQLLPGDLLYYQDGSSPRNGHISMYAGNGLVVEAANPRRGVRVRTLDEAWYADRFVAAIRIG